jgi:hypothetical protein
MTARGLVHMRWCGTCLTQISESCATVMIIPARVQVTRRDDIQSGPQQDVKPQSEHFCNALQQMSMFVCPASKPSWYLKKGPLDGKWVHSIAAQDPNLKGCSDVHA